MDVNILGPLDIRGRDGREIRLPAGREQALLALLLIHRGEVVSNDRIVDALWGSQPPETAAKAVQGYVSHLRRVLGPEREPGDARTFLDTQPPGYVLRADAVAVDAIRFERLAGEGRRALDDGAAAEAATLLDEALALWRGQALAEFAFDDFARHEIDRLEELRLSATEDRIDALLRLGRHGAVTGQLTSLVAAHPLRERLRGQLMVALYRSGRQADALEAYRDGRRLLAGELGLEPGPELQRLERAILAQDAALEVAARDSPPPLTESSAGPTSPGSRSAARRRRRRIAVGGVLLALALAAVLVAAVRAHRHGPGTVKVVAPAVVAVDAHTNRIVASIPAGSNPSTIASGEGAIWVGDGRDGTVMQIDPVTRRVVKTIGIGAPAIDLAAGLGSVWVANGSFGTVVRIDPGLGAVADVIDLAKPGDPIVPTVSSVAAGHGQVWVGAFDGLVRIAADSGKVIKTVDLGHSPALQIALGNGALWATLETRRAKRVDTGSAKETGFFYEGTLTVAIALDRSAVWLAGIYGGQLWQIDSLTGSQVRTSRAGGGSNAIAVGDGGVWVASWSDNALLRLDPETAAVVATIPLAGVPADVTVRDGLVWVAVQSAPAAG